MVEKTHKFTEAKVAELRSKCRSGRVEYRDAEVPALRLRVSPTSASWSVLKRVPGGKMIRVLIGKTDAINATDARKQARVHVGQMQQGHDPNETKRARRAEASREAATLAKLMAAYVEHLKAAEKASWRDVERAIERHIIPRKTLAATPAELVTVDMVMPLFHALTKDGKLREAEKLRAYLRAAYAAARKARTDATMHAFAGLQIRENPLLDLDVSRPKEAAEKAATAARERKWALSEAQLAAYWSRIQAMEAPEGPMLVLHLLTGGQRVEQLSRVTRADHDSDAKTITLRDTKGRRQVAHEHVVPLLPEAQAALEALQGEGQYMVTVDGGESPAGYHRFWEAVSTVAQAMVEAKEVDRLFTPGTIRKTVETRLAAKGIPDEVLARLLSHGLGGVQARNYNAHRYDDEKRSALRKLRALCDPVKAKVLPFPKSG